MSSHGAVHIYANGDVACKQADWFCAIDMQWAGEIPLRLLCKKCRTAIRSEIVTKARRLRERDRMVEARKRHKGPIAGQTTLNLDPEGDDDAVRSHR